MGFRTFLLGDIGISSCLTFSMIEKAKKVGKHAVIECKPEQNVVLG